jgi:hypothetical protein
MDWYRQFRAAVLVLAAAGLGACARDATSPTTTAPRFAVAGSAGSYLVLFKGAGVPSDLGARVQALGGTVTYSHAGAGIATVAGIDAAGAATLAAGKDVADVEPDFTFSLDQPAAAAAVDAAADFASSQSNPAGAGRFAWQWNMRLIKADQAWAAGKLGSPGVTVAILDTGIDYDATDLNGLVDLSRSVSFVAFDDAITNTYFPTRSRIDDYNGHGTNVATQVSSKAAALAGVTSKTTLIGVKVLSGFGSGSLSSVLNGVLWAADHGADVANMSLGGGFAKAGLGQYVALINKTFNYAKQRGMLVVVAAGNEEQDLDHDGNLYKTYCDAPHVLCVSAVGPTTWTGVGDQFAFYSNFGRSAIGVAGPGGNAEPVDGGYLVSAWPWGNDIASWVWSYCAKHTLVFDAQHNILGTAGCTSGHFLTGFIGTSQATPHVAGLAALLVDKLGHGKPQLIKQAIEKSADDLGQPGTDPFYGRGRVNVARAMGL